MLFFAKLTLSWFALNLFSNPQITFYWMVGGSLTAILSVFVLPFVSSADLLTSVTERTQLYHHGKLLT